MEDATALYFSSIFHRGRFNSSQLAGMAPEHEATQIGWYNRFARHPYFGKTGINSGVMLFNLTRVRQTFFKARSLLVQFMNMWFGLMY